MFRTICFGLIGLMLNTAFSQNENLNFMNDYLKETEILDFSNQSIQALIKQKKWMEKDPVKRVKSVYNFVRDEILFGYNISDDITASEVLSDGFGQCNTKSTLLMALLRSVKIPNRIHGFTIDKALQKGAISGLWYKMAPNNILHSWVEVYVNEKWYFLEGVILDKKYLNQLQNLFAKSKSTFCGFGVFTENFENPQIEWNLNNTYIQEKGINQDFGIFDSPDDFYEKHMQKLNIVKKIIFKMFARKSMNNNIKKIREKTNASKTE